MSKNPQDLGLVSSVRTDKSFKATLSEKESPNSDFLTELRSKLPQFFTAEKRDEETGEIIQAAEFDLEKFKANLAKNNINEIHDGYTLNYVGKTYARLQVGQPTPTVIIPDKVHNDELANAKSKNVFLTGDNLDVLKHLRGAYTGKIDFIYIDPPYNTGSDGFVYNDRFDLKDEDLRDTLGFSDDDITRLHLLNGRSSHSAWLTFMYPRLKIAQQLLKDTGVIFVSIDDNEQANLKLLMDDVFGEGNFVGEIIWHKKTQPSFLSKTISNIKESIFLYSKNNSTELRTMGGMTNPDRAVEMLNISNTVQKRVLKKDNVLIGNGKFSGTLTAGSYGNGELAVELLNNLQVIDGKPDTDVEIIGRFKWSQDTMNNSFENEDLYQIKSTQTLRPTVTINEREAGIKPIIDLFSKKLNDEIPTNTDATNEIKSMFDGVAIFSNPKPKDLIKYLIRSITFETKDSLILDFFAGSATTADAVMQLNAEDGGHRQYILATLDEEAKSEVAKSAGYQTIDEISRERIKRAAAKIREKNPLTTTDQDFGFKHFYVKDIDAQTVDKLLDFDPDAIKLIADDMVAEFGKPFTTLAGNEISTGASGADTILQTWLVDDGFSFDQTVEKLQLDQHSAHQVENLLYIIAPIDQADIKALLNRIGEHQLNVSTIIVFGYSLPFEVMTSLKNNVKIALDGVKVEVRW
ncbi:MAG: site-specific DNA-methyltransferase [Streptococcaceae bacterium]|jgi:adenine-specific DNA-methyltransferase|nr:site-specific DNA-methyltransferase [Streptococcaceae bacterium]